VFFSARKTVVFGIAEKYRFYVDFITRKLIKKPKQGCPIGFKLFGLHVKPSKIIF
jgi:hypothetical protein